MLHNNLEDAKNTLKINVFILLLNFIYLECCRLIGMTTQTKTTKLLETPVSWKQTQQVWMDQLSLISLIQLMTVTLVWNYNNVIIQCTHRMKEEYIIFLKEFNFFFFFSFICICSETQHFYTNCLTVS